MHTLLGYALKHFMYEGYISCLVVVWYLVMPYVRHVYVLFPLVRHHVWYLYMLLPFFMLYVRHACLGLHIAVSLKGRTTCIWYFGCSFTCATAMGCTGFRLLFGIIIVL